MIEGSRGRVRGRTLLLGVGVLAPKPPLLTCRARRTLDEARGKGVPVQGGGEAALAALTPRPGRACWSFGPS